MSDRFWMQQALHLAQKGRYVAHPNPMVGAVLVQGKRVVGQGWHMGPGTPHAEIMALSQAGAQARGATCYVTLAPCGHWGHMPPCADQLIHAQVARVVVPFSDPNPKAAPGLERMRLAGIAICQGVEVEAATRLNAGFLSRFQKQRPWVRAKVARSLEGATALASGESQWITGTLARDEVHEKRAQSGAILTGVGTLLADNPRLSARCPEAQKQPCVVVLDTHGRTPQGARVFEGQGGVIIATAEGVASHPQADAHWVLPQNALGHVSLMALMHRLAAHGINDLWVESGPTVLGALLAERLVDELWVYEAGAVLGSQARPAWYLPSPKDLLQADRFVLHQQRRVGDTARSIWLNQETHACSQVS